MSQWAVVSLLAKTLEDPQCSRLKTGFWLTGCTFGTVLWLLAIFAASSYERHAYTRVQHHRKQHVRLRPGSSKVLCVCMKHTLSCR